MEKPNSFLRMSLNYHVLPNKIAIGPFENIDDPNKSPKNQITYTIFPEEDLLYQEIVLKAVFGFRFKTN